MEVVNLNAMTEMPHANAAKPRNKLNRRRGMVEKSLFTLFLVSN